MATCYGDAGQRHPSFTMTARAWNTREPSTPLQAAREDAAAGMPPMAAAAIRKGLWDADEHVQGRLHAMEALRERCARVAEDAHHADGLGWTPKAIATAIRAIEIKGEEG